MKIQGHVSHSGYEARNPQKNEKGYIYFPEEVASHLGMNIGEPTNQKWDGRDLTLKMATGSSIKHGKLQSYQGSTDNCRVAINEGKAKEVYTGHLSMAPVEIDCDFENGTPVAKLSWPVCQLDEPEEAPASQSSEDEFRTRLTNIINSCSKENGCNTPDFILADYLNDCLVAFDNATKARESWYGKYMEPGK